MAIYLSDIVQIDLTGSNLSRSFSNRNVGKGDNSGNVFGVRVTKDGEPVSMSGVACTGYFIRSDGITLVINGETSGNEAWVTLPEAAYAVAGNYTLAIKLSGTGFAETVRVIDGTVINTTTGDVNDPAGALPTLADYEAKVARAEAAAEEIDDLHISSELITGTRYKLTVTKT